MLDLSFSDIEGQTQQMVTCKRLFITTLIL